MNFVSERIKLFYRINNTGTIPHTFELKSTSKYQLLFHRKSFEIIRSFILYLEAGETELINACVVPFAITECGQKCLEAASTLKHEPLKTAASLYTAFESRRYLM